MKSALKIHVTGIVQGVGFRPFVYRQAKLHLINGWVINSADGVHIHAEGDEKLLDEFCLALANEAPAAANVEDIEMKEVPLEIFDKFEIRQSEDKKTSKAGEFAGSTLISPDLATCDDCVQELFDENDRRFRYPFINCTNCGPRFTIIGKLPYDRCYTSMCTFKMCGVCNDEYHIPTDRRFHAQPDACFECGPKISWISSNDVKRSKRAGFQGAKAGSLGSLCFWGEDRKSSDEIFGKCVDFLLQGKIVAIKGLGGFHLACDATNEEAVKKLRKSKYRSNKAFAIMANDINSVKKICRVNKTEEEVLNSPAHPIVLLKAKGEFDSEVFEGKLFSFQNLACDVTMGLYEVGVMLPYTPVQHILMQDFVGAGGQYLVMTSGNIYDNPIVIDDEEVYDILLDVADAFLGNNRRILARYDDSVVRIINAGGIEAVQMIRRARGYAPAPIKIKKNNFPSNTSPSNSPTLPNESLALGAEQKNTFAFLRPIVSADSDSKHNAEVFVSQHIGDVENAEIYSTWEKTKNQYEELFKIKPKEIRHDLHPEYLVNKSICKNSKSIGVQHHYAHIRSVMYENNLEGPVLGFAFDGTGYGMDKNIWGGEALLCNTQDFERFANFVYIPLPGGSAAIKEPLRVAYGALWTYDLLEHAQAKKILQTFSSEEIENFNTMIEDGINTPMTSSVGRLFDAVSAMLDICPKPTYEGESACLLEAYLQNNIYSNPKLKKAKFDERYEIQISKNIATKNSTAQDTSVVLLDPSNSFKAILDDISNNVEKSVIIKNFHEAISQSIAACSNLCENLYGITQIAISGGVFMNRYLIENTIENLIEQGFSVALNREVPPNDGGISLGQL